MEDNNNIPTANAMIAISNKCDFISNWYCDALSVSDDFINEATIAKTIEAINPNIIN
jgi:hypothetical protein